MKSIKEKILKRQLDECQALNQQNNNISVNLITIQDKKEYYLDINISKKIFTAEEILTNNLIPLDINFILHITPNFPINAPKLFCLTSLNSININICDGKNILNLIIENDNWTNNISAKEIILKIPPFLINVYKQKKNNFFIGKYELEYVYDYKILQKVPNSYFEELEQVINEKTSYTEQRLLMITDYFFLIFSFEKAFLSSYYNIKLVFWASIKSIYGMKNNEERFQFEFSKTDKNRLFLTFNTQEGEKITSVVTENLKKMNIIYSVKKRKITDSKVDNNQQKKEDKLLPQMDNKENKAGNEENKIENKNKIEEQKN